MAKIIAVDFDGTLCVNAFPNIGEPRKEIIQYIFEEKEKGSKLILWTNRCGHYLDEAVEWCKQQGIIFDAINENLPESIEHFGDDPRKVFAHEFLDDRALSLSLIERFYKLGGTNRRMIQVMKEYE
jgi:hypothetical protein